MHHTGRVIMGTMWASALSPDTHKKPHEIDHAHGLRGQAPKFPGYCVWCSPLPLSQFPIPHYVTLLAGLSQSLH
jgi:hypothetical protein